jgi:hypothetical protein
MFMISVFSSIFSPPFYSPFCEKMYLQKYFSKKDTQRYLEEVDFSFRILDVL